jgi:predicted nucleic acid-binding protein
VTAPPLPNPSVRRIVVDASVAVKWLLPEQGSAHAIALLEAGHDLCAPDLLISEIGNVLWKRVRRDGLAAESAQRLLAEFINIRLRWMDTRRLAPEALAIASEYGRSYYDSVYLALAHAVDGQLITADERFVNALATTPHAARVLILTDATNATE